MLQLDKVNAILAEVSFNDWTIEAHRHIDHLSSNGGRMYLQVRVKGKCNVNGSPWEWTGRKWDLSIHMTKSEIVQTAFKAVMTAMEHEVREQFLYKGVSIFDPHYDVDKLVTLRRKTNCLDERK